MARKPGEDVERENPPDDVERERLPDLPADENDAEGDVENAAALGAGTDTDDVERETP